MTGDVSTSTGMFFLFSGMTHLSIQDSSITKRSLIKPLSDFHRYNAQFPQAPVDSGQGQGDPSQANANPTK